MEKVTVDRMMEDVNKHLAKYQELVGQRAVLQERLRKAEKEKHSVRDVIYRKVCDEYHAGLKTLAEELRPLESMMDEARQTFTTEIADLEKQMKDTQDKLDELTFRHRVGEFEDGKLTEKQAPMKKTVSELGAHKDAISEMLSRIEASKEGSADALAPDSSPSERASTSKSPAASKETPPAETPTAAKETPSKEAPAADKEAAKQEAPTASKETPAKAPANPNLVNPSDWTKEFQDDSGQKMGRRATDAPAAATSDKQSHSDPLSTLADPSEEGAAKAKTETGVGTKEPPKTFPVLIITKGPGSGKKIPLLPMTMTVGREHDNNIELKDEDVARYHARISFQNGEYVMQDMESSSGTWINGKKVTEVALDHGDKVRFGSTEMLVDFE